MTRRFRISLAPLGGGPENHLSGKKSGSAPHYPLTVLATICLILLAPQSARLSCWGFCCGGLYGPLTLDYNERARGLTLVVSLWLPPQTKPKVLHESLWAHAQRDETRSV